MRSHRSVVGASCLVRTSGHRLASAVLAAGLAACGMTGPAHGPAPRDATVVEMTNGFHFSPARILVPVGGTVEWRNVSLFTHTVTADPRRASVATDVHLPEGAAAFDSGEVPAGEIYRHRFDTPGTYRYICRPHEHDGMMGTVIVGSATSS